MPISNNPAIIALQVITQLAKRLDATPHNSRGEIILNFATQFGWSNAKVYRQLKTVGWSSCRKSRSDKGQTSQDPEALTHLSAAVRLGVRKNGKITMQTPNARSMLSANGRQFAVGNARLNTLMKERCMDIKKQKQPSAYQPQKSLYPNHVHQVDPSLCLIYYLKDGSQKILGDDEIYKNKPENIERLGSLKVWRYVLTDHYSSTIIVRYYQAKGETQENLFDFLLYAWKKLGDRVFHGVPKILSWDKGSANTAKAIACALCALDVEAITHEAGNPRAKGSVEQSNNLVEKLFESRLRYEPVKNIDEINYAVESWYNAYNSDSIPYYDAKLSRRFMAEPKARYSIWQIINKNQLRILPDEELCRYLLSAKPEERKVRADLSVSFKHPNKKRTSYYDISHIDGVYPRAIIKVSPLIYGEAQIIVYVENYQGIEQTFIIDAIEADSFSGFANNAAIIGEEYKSQPDTVIEQAGKAADRAAFPNKDEDEIKKEKNKNHAPFNGTIDAHSHLRNVRTPDYMQRPGSELSIPDRKHTEIKPLTNIEACKRLISELGRIDGVNYHDIVSQYYPEGVPLSEFDELVKRITQPVTALSVINGGK